MFPLLVLILGVQSYTPNDFDAQGATCSSHWPQQKLLCPTYCIRFDAPRRDDAQLLSICQATCEEGEVLFHDGRCAPMKGFEDCDGQELQLTPSGLWACQDADVSKNPCACLSETETFQACPAREVTHPHYSPGLDYHPPQLETMQMCSTIRNDTDLRILKGDDSDGDQGFLQCPLSINKIPAYSPGGWATLAILYLICCFTIFAWALRKFFAERKLMKPGQPPVSVFESNFNDEEDAASVNRDTVNKDKDTASVIGKTLPIERQDTGLESTEKGVITLQTSGLMGQIGYKQPWLGSLGLIAFVTIVVSKPILMFVYILDAYGFFGATFCPEETSKCLASTSSVWSFRLGWPCGAHCLVTDAWSTGINRFWPWNKMPYGGKMYLVAFIHTWLLGVVIFLAAIACRTAARAAFRQLTPLRSAQLVEVQVPARPRVRVERSKNDLLDRYMEWENSVVARWFGTRIERKVCRVDEDVETGTRFFTFRSQRYVWSNDLGKFARVGIDVGTDSCEKVHNTNNSRIGLTDMEARNRVAILGFNLVTIPMPTLKRSLFEEFFRLDFIYQVFCLLVWCVFYYWFAATVVFIVCLVSCGIRISSKRQSQKRLKSLAEAVTTVTVIREGAKRILASHSLAVGDIVVVTSGQEVAADMILLSGTCVMNESALTGEPNPVPKTPLPRDPRVYDPKFLDAKSTLFAGTSVTAVGSENVRAVVHRVGAMTDRGQMLSQIMTPTKLAFKFDRQWNAVFGILLVWGFINVVIGVILVDWSLEGWYYGIFTISQVMSPLLPAVFVSGQATTARRLAKSERVHCVNLQRTMVAGKVRHVCFDKTGTLTEAGLSMNKLMVYNGSQFEDEEIRTLADLRKYGATELEWGLKLCHELQMTFDGDVVGQDVDIGMFEFAQARIISESNIATIEDLNTLECRYILRRFEFMRSSMSSSVITCSAQSPSTLTVYTKGSWETISRMCSNITSDLSATVDRLANQGLYVLTLAQKHVNNSDANLLGSRDSLDLSSHLSKAQEISRDMCQCDLELLGLIVFKNALLSDTPDVIAELKEGDCVPVMVTGDHHLTACKIARDCLIVDSTVDLILINSDSPESLVFTNLNHPEHLIESVEDLVAEMSRQPCQLAITGPALDVLDRPFSEQSITSLLVSHTKVFARMTPQHKVKVVEMFMSQGVTAMVGDGANDAAALERSHCGVAVRSGAAGAAKEASVVAHFASERASLRPVVDVFRHGRCALAMTTAAYKNLIVYGEVMVCLSFIEMWLKIVPPEGYFILVDAVVNSGMTWAIMRSKPAEKLAPKRPSSSLLGYETMFSAGLQILNHWIWAAIIFAVLFSQDWFQCRQFDPRFVDHADWWTKGDNYEASTLGLLCMFQWITVGPTFNFSGGFRRGWLKNWEVWSLWIFFLLFTLIILWTTGTGLTCMFRTNCGDASLLNFWFSHKIWDGVVQNPVIGSSIFIPEGCGCEGDMCENEYIIPCGNTTFNSAFHHNIYPWSFRSTFTYLIIGNLICAILLERVVILGPIGRLFRKN